MDGVIIDSEPLHFEVEAKLLEELGGVFDLDYHNTLVGTNDVLMWSIFKEKFSLKDSLEDIIQMKKERFLNEIHRVPMVEGFENLISFLHNEGYVLGLASSNNRESVNKIISIFNLNKYLSFSVSGDEVKKGKPDPEIFLKAAEILKLPAKDCLVFEDAKNGIEAAKSAGMKCIAYRNPNSGPQDLSQADLIIDNYDEINLTVLKNLFKD